MPPITVTGLTASSGCTAPREFAILHQVGVSDGAVDAEALLTVADVYAGDGPAVKNLLQAAKNDSNVLDFESLAKALAKPSQAASAEGIPDGNTLGWAARDKSGVLSPYRFKRRELQRKDIKVKITHAGMCHTDLSAIRSEYGPARYPNVPGHEIVGIVTEVGPEVIKFKPGDRAGVCTFTETCRECSMCKRGEDIFCPKVVRTYDLGMPGANQPSDGLPAQGGYSNHIVIDEWFALKVPANLELAGVAPLLCAGITTYAPFKDHGLDKPGLKLGVVGLGGLGHMAVKWGVAFGSEVYVISRSKAKEAEALALGAKAIIPSGDAEAMKAAAGTLDGIIDTVAAKHDMNALFELLAPRGRLIIVGVPPKPPQVNHVALIQKCMVFAGSMVGNLGMTQEMLDFCGQKGITASVEVIDMEYVNEAMERMHAGDVKFRFVIDINKSLSF